MGARATTRGGAPPRRAVGFTFLGRVAVEPPERPSPIEVRGTQPALVLAYLVLERPRPLLRDDLVELLWPGPLPDHWEGASRQVVSRARRALTEAGLPPESISSASGLTVLDLGDELTVDVELAVAEVLDAERLVLERQWERAAGAAGHALEQLRRPFLAVSDCRWATDWRERVDAFARRALYAHAGAALGAGRAADAEALARAALERDPFDEQATRLLMTACEQSGDRARALGAYERLRRVLDDELGVRPSDDTEEAYRNLLGAPPHGRVDAAVRSRPVPADTGLFVGRDHETAVLNERWRRAEAGTCQVVVLEGEAGIGKTRLALELARGPGADGATILWGRCDPQVAVAHGPFADLLGQLLTERPDIGDRLGPLAGHLAPLVPQLVPASTAGAPDSPDQVTTRLFRAVGTALQVAAEDPVIVLLDDLHWADADTLALLQHAVSWLADRPALLVVTLRDAPPPVADALAELQRRAATTTLTLSGLGVDDVVELIQASPLTWDGELLTVAQVIVTRTAGNPLYVTELLREATTTGLLLDPSAVPEAVARLLGRRLTALEPDLASVLVLAAVAGPVFDLATLEACTTFGPDDLLDLVENLCARRFLEERAPGRFGFAHDLVRDATLATVGATRQSRLHHRLADVLARAGADPGVVANHYVAGGSACLPDAVTWSLTAGHAALRGAAWATAREHFATASRLAPDDASRCEALIGLGRALRAVGDLTDARASVEDALTVAQRRGLARLAAAATLALVGGGGRGVALDLDDEERARLLRAALAGLHDRDDDLRVPLLAELTLAIVLTDATDERRALCDACLTAARRWGHPSGLATALWARRFALMGPPGTTARVRDGEEVLHLPRADVAPESVVAAHLGLVEDLLELGDRAGADRALDDATRLATELDHPYWSWATACWRTLTTIVDGHLDDAERQAFAALEQQTGDHPEAVATLGVNLVDVRLFQGRAGEMIDLLHGAAADAPHIPAYRAALALCCAEAGDHAGAAAAYGHFAARGFELPEDSNWLLAVAALADTCATLGDTAGAASLTELLEPWADRQVILNCYGGGGAYWGPVAHHLGRLALLRDDRCCAEALLHRAVEHAEHFRAPRVAARSRAQLAQLT